MLGIDMGFWIGMGVVTFIVIIGCIMAWCLPPKKNIGACGKGGE